MKRYDWYPMIRGRLVAINGKRGRRPTTMTEERAKRLVDREFNLSHAAALPPHNSWSPAAGRADEADAHERRGGPGARRWA